MGVCYSPSQNTYDINGADLISSTAIYVHGTSCTTVAGSNYYKDNSGTFYWDGSTLVVETCPYCNQNYPVYFSDTSVCDGCYGGTPVNVSLNGSDLANSTVVYDENPPCENIYGKSFPLWLRDASGTFYWDGTVLSAETCPTCYQVNLYDSNICFCFGGGNPYVLDNTSLTNSTTIYTDCCSGTKASAGYYSENCGTGADVYYFDGNNTITYDSTC
jgi:hypothetical protein